jgi:hypothetical protein
LTTQTDEPTPERRNSEGPRVTEEPRPLEGRIPDSITPTLTLAANPDVKNPNETPDVEIPSNANVPRDVPRPKPLTPEPAEPTPKRRTIPGSSTPGDETPMEAVVVWPHRDEEQVQFAPWKDVLAFEPELRLESFLVGELVVAPPLDEFSAWPRNLVAIRIWKSVRKR